MYIHTYIHTYIHFVCVCIGEASFNRWLQRRTGSTYINVCIYIYIHTYIHTHTHVCVCV